MAVQLGGSDHRRRGQAPAFLWLRRLAGVRGLRDLLTAPLPFSLRVFQ